MAMLALKALDIGSEKIPDKAFHAIPGGYFRPRDADSNKKSRSSSRRKDRMHDNGDDVESRRDKSDRGDRHRHRRKSDDYSASESGSDTEDDAKRNRPRRPARRNRRYTSSQNLERGYDSDGLTPDQYQQSRGVPPPSQSGQDGIYFPPPPVYSYEAGPEANVQAGADGAFDPIFTSGVPQHNPQGGQYNRRQTSPTGKSRQLPPEFGTPRPGSAASTDRHRQNPSYSPQSEQWEPKRNSFNSGYTPHAGYANNYNTTGYQAHQPPQSYYPPQAGPNQGALAVQPPVQQPDTGHSTALAPYNMPPPQNDPNVNGAYPTYIPPQDNWRPDRSPSRDGHRKYRSSRSDERSSSTSRSRSRTTSRDRSRDRRRGRNSDRQSKSRNRSKSVAAQAKNALKDNRDVFSSGLGVVAGGLIGDKLGRGNKLGTLAGAVIGGFGANYWEKHHADKKEVKEKRRQHSQGVVRDVWDERRVQSEEHRDRDQQHNSTTSRSTKSYPDERKARLSHERYDPALPFRERSRHPYARSNAPLRTYTPKAYSPHVHFAILESKDYVNTSTKTAAKDLKTQFERAASQGMRDASTQTDPPPWRDIDYKKDYSEGRKDFVKKMGEKGALPTDKVYQAPRSIKKATRKGTWDGSVVEEVFMEMTGVTVGAKDYMKSNWTS